MNQTVQEKAGGGFLRNLCAWALERRRACYLIVAALAVLCCFSSEWAEVREDSDAFLPADSEARQGLEVMRNEFGDFRTGRILVENISAPQAETLSEKLSLAAGVRSVDFDERSGYRTGSALLTVTFRDTDAGKALSELRFLLEGYDYSIAGDTGGLYIQGEVWLITALLCAAALVAAALFVRIPAVTEISVILLTFGAAFLLNSGTWFLTGPVSAAAVVLSGLLQLALCAFCAGPFFRHCVRARARMSSRDAVMEAWRCTAPGAFAGMAVMFAALAAVIPLQLRIGADPALTLAKAVILTLVVFAALTPGLLLDLCEPLDRTRARKVGKNSSGVSDFALGTRFLMPAVLIAALVASGICLEYLPRTYGTDAIPVWFPWGTHRADGKIEALFGSQNELSILVPSGDASREGALLDELSAMEEVSAARGLANMETMGGYTLGERLTPRQFAELMDLDMDAARQIYSAYIQAAGTYGHLAAGVDNAAIPLAEMLLFTCDRAREGYVTLDWGQDNALELLYKRTENAVRQMRGADYSRLIVTLSVPEGNAKALAFLYTLRSTVGRYYPQGVLFTGDTVRDTDLSTAFHHDRILFTALVLAVAFVASFLLSGSMGIAALSALAAQCGVWLTLALFLLVGTLYFLADFLLGAVLMGFGLLFAALLAQRWNELKADTESQTALLRALRDVSGPLSAYAIILALVCVAAGILTGNRAASFLALCMGAGIVIEALLTLLVLPQTLSFLPDTAEKSADAFRYPQAGNPVGAKTVEPAERSGSDKIAQWLENSERMRNAERPEESAATPELAWAEESPDAPETLRTVESAATPELAWAEESPDTPETLRTVESAATPELAWAEESPDAPETDGDTTEVLDLYAPDESPESGERGTAEESREKEASSDD